MGLSHWIRHCTTIAMGAPLGLACGVVAHAWWPEPPPVPHHHRTGSPAAATTDNRPAPRLAALRRERQSLTDELETLRLELADRRRAAGGGNPTRAQRHARRRWSPPWREAGHQAGLSAKVADLLKQGLVEPDPSQIEAIQAQAEERWQLAAPRIELGVPTGAQLHPLRDDRSVLVLGRNRVVVVDLHQAVACVDARLPAPITTWRQDEAGRQLAVGTRDGRIATWRVADGATLAVSQVPAPLYALVHDADASHWLACAGDGIHRLDDRRLLPRGHRPWRRAPDHAWVDPHRDRLLLRCGEDLLRWTRGDDRTVAVAAEVPPPREAQLVWSRDGDRVGWSSDGAQSRWLAFAGGGGALPGRLVDWLGADALVAHDGRLRRIAPDGGDRLRIGAPVVPVVAVGDTLVTGTEPAILWDRTTLLPRQALWGGAAPMLAITPDRSGQRAISLHADGRLWLWQGWEVAP